jgi:hypothetical protein
MKKPVQDYKIDYQSILETIPQNSHIEPQENLNKMIETRWRFLSIPLPNEPNKFKNVVEISRRRPDCPREYLNKCTKWIITTVDPIFDQFLVKQYYYYSEQ